MRETGKKNDTKQYLIIGNKSQYDNIIKPASPGSEVWRTVVVFVDMYQNIYDLSFILFHLDETWEQRWIYSTSKGSDAGKFKLTSGKFYGDKERDQGIQTEQDAKFYQLSAKIDTPFSNEGKPLVLQYQVKHEQNIDCGGGYIKIFPKIEAEKMNGDSPYNIMFGPDICGPGTKKVHVIFNYKGKNLLTKKDIR